MDDDLPERLAIAESRERAATVLEVAGEVDVETVAALRDALAVAVERGEGDVVVDLSGVTFLDSSGLAALLNALRRLRRAGHALVVAAPSEPVAQVLRLSRLEGDLGSEPSVEAALARGRRPG